MYKFTNGIVVFDEETRDKYIKAGYILVKEEPKKEVEDGETNSKAIAKEYTGKSKDTNKNRKSNWR